ncbi:acyltransferase family protein [Hymenobacter chitinivorans]|uniref:Peptidoglycan/LPS O-acetylase OafA/YrhL n=1 Tax=Hymenobacter chitinivorans DSM 11115 TaxID=1121954 RepID=A0A2M9BQE2_9BACT|nr:acyltransferase [Hymenobacter chitinivorans]PJJ60128.1 peptidoglycan/LPS O-acetylase OafA/YrhL [Hymenobacter chitinivorans DSM 11115]
MRPAAYVPALTGFRALAALSVFLFHFPPVTAGGSAVFSVLHALFREGHVGVSLFFTLSGFLIARRYSQQHLAGPALRTYLFRRWARIYPVFFLVTTATFVFSKLYQNQDALRLYLVNITLLKGLLPNYAFTAVAQSWSLTTEECFYLLAPGLFWLGRRAAVRWWVGAALALALMGFLVYGVLFPTPESGFARFHFMLVVTIFGRSTEFLLGAAWALAPAGWLRRRATLLGALGVLVVGGGLAAIQLHFGKVSIDTPLGVAVNNLVLPAATGLLLYGLATEATRLQAVLSTKVFQVLGRASYCFYLLHMGFLHDFLLRWLPTGWPAALLYGLVLLLTVAASLALYYLVEQPVHRWLLSRGRPVAVAG